LPGLAPRTLLKINKTNQDKITTNEKQQDGEKDPCYNLREVWYFRFNKTRNHDGHFVVKTAQSQVFSNRKNGGTFFNGLYRPLKNCLRRSSDPRDPMSRGNNHGAFGMRPPS
jgi:hypothetical protein